MQNAFLGFLILLLTATTSQAFDTRATAALVIDHDSGTVLLEKNADRSLPPASMSKLMTLAMLFEALKEGRLTLNSKLRVSTKAWQMGGSKMFVKEGDSIAVEDLIRGIIVQSGNDACVVVAEGLAGSEAEFANRMTKRARKLGMTDSVFANSTGWPHPDHRMSARDLGILATHIITEYPEYYPYFAELSFEWAEITQENRNPLLYLDIGADGLKTGHTEEAGYGLVGSALQDGRRVTFVIMGLTSSSERSAEGERLTSWAFREFATETLFEKNEVITTADVWLGAANEIELVSKDDLNILIPYAARDDVTAKVVYQGPIEAPINAGDPVANLIVEIPGLADQQFPLLASESVARGGFLTRFMASAQLLTQKVFDTATSNVQ